MRKKRSVWWWKHYISYQVYFCWAKRTHGVSDNEAIMCINTMVNTNPRRAKPRFAGKVTRKNLWYLAEVLALKFQGLSWNDNKDYCVAQRSKFFSWTKSRFIFCGQRESLHVICFIDVGENWVLLVQIKLYLQAMINMNLADGLLTVACILSCVNDTL